MVLWSWSWGNVGGVEVVEMVEMRGSRDGGSAVVVEMAEVM